MSPVQPPKTRQGGAEGTQSASGDPLSLRSLRVGDECVIDTTKMGAIRTTVQSVGRRWLRADGIRFDLDDGFNRPDFGPSIRAFTPAEYEREVKLRAVRKALADLVYNQHRVSKSRLLAIHDALKAAGLL